MHHCEAIGDTVKSAKKVRKKVGDMVYFGSKRDVLHHLSPVLNHSMFSKLAYHELFVGSGCVLASVKNKVSYCASDLSPLLITLLTAVQRGIPLPYISKARYKELRSAKSNDVETATAAYVYSFRGKEWGGYAAVGRDGRHYAVEQRKQYEALRQSSSFCNAKLLASCYSEQHTPKGMLIYADPPYENTMSYSINETPFDHIAFWNCMREWSKSNFVFVSELMENKPHDFLTIRCYSYRGRREGLFVWKHMRDIHKVVDMFGLASMQQKAVNKPVTTKAVNQATTQGISKRKRKMLRFSSYAGLDVYKKGGECLG
jgi:site-specific DNA-adenine methylase